MPRRSPALALSHPPCTGPPVTYDKRVGRVVAFGGNENGVVAAAAFIGHGHEYGGV